MKTINEHLQDLKRKSVYLFGFLAILFTVGYYISNYLVSYILNSYDLAVEFMLFNPLDIIYLQMYGGLIVTVLLGLPVIVFTLLSYFEIQKFTINTILVSYSIIALLGAIGTYLGVFYIAPVILNYLLTLSSFVVYWNVLSTVSFIFMIGILFGLILQLIIILPFLQLSQLIDTKNMTQYRKHYFVGIIVLSGIITPPDPFSLILVALPLLLSIEFGITLSSLLTHFTKNSVRRETIC